jgi:hypothetical protein
VKDDRPEVAEHSQKKHRRATQHRAQNRKGDSPS